MQCGGSVQGGVTGWGAECDRVSSSYQAGSPRAAGYGAMYST
jgi:hypothetical protein